MSVRSVKVRDGFSLLKHKIIEMNFCELIREKLNAYLGCFVLSHPKTSVASLLDFDPMTFAGI